MLKGEISAPTFKLFDLTSVTFNWASDGSTTESVIIDPVGVSALTSKKKDWLEEDSGKLQPGRAPLTQVRKSRNDIKDIVFCFDDLHIVTVLFM